MSRFVRLLRNSQNEYASSWWLDFGQKKKAEDLNRSIGDPIGCLWRSSALDKKVYEIRSI